MTGKDIYSKNLPLYIPYRKRNEQEVESLIEKGLAKYPNDKKDVPYSEILYLRADGQFHSDWDWYKRKESEDVKRIKENRQAYNSFTQNFFIRYFFTFPHIWDVLIVIFLGIWGSNAIPMENYSDYMSVIGKFCFIFAASYLLKIFAGKDFPKLSYIYFSFSTVLIQLTRIAIFIYGLVTFFNERSLLLL